jgi:hypothetical protein
LELQHTFHKDGKEKNQQIKKKLTEKNQSRKKINLEGKAFSFDFKKLKLIEQVSQIRSVQLIFNK